MERKTRGKPSKIDGLPDAIKERLHELLRGSQPQSEILAIVNQLIDDAGLQEDDKISRSGLNRYASKMETLGQQIRETREIADAWVARLGTKPTGEVSQLLIELLRTAHFKLLMKTAEDPEEVLDPETLGDLALSIGRLEKAAMLSTQREKELRKAFAEEAAQAVGEELRGHDGISEELENRVRDVLLGKA